MKNINKMTLDEMNIEIERLAKRANVRIRALEQSTDPETDYPFYLAQQLTIDGNTNYSAGRPRFSRAKAKNVQIARTRIKNLKKFLFAKTTTARGRTQLKKEQYEKYKKERNIELPFSVFRRILQMLNKLDIHRPSEEVIDLLTNIYRREGNLPTVDQLAEFIKRNPVDPVTVYEENMIDWSEYQI